MKPWILGVAVALALAVPAVLLAEEVTIVVVERSDDAGDETHHESNCEGLPAGSTKVEAENLQEAVDQIADALGEDDCVKNLHFRGHGSPGNQSVGDGVNHEAGKRINGHKDEWGEQLGGINFCDDATIHLWGCNVGAGEDGACKLQEIADCTGATVRGAVNTVNAGDQEEYEGPICEAMPDEEKPECQEPADEKAKKKKKKTEDEGCVTTADAFAFGAGDGWLNTEDVGCDGIPGTFDFGEGDGLLNLGEGGTSLTGCLIGPGEDVGCDNEPGTFDAGEGNGVLDTEDDDGDGELTVYDLGGGFIRLPPVTDPLASRSRRSGSGE
jgi:hypothetical protein